MLRHLLFLLMLPFLSLGQSEFTETRTAVFFAQDVSKSDQLEILTKHGLSVNEVVPFVSVNVIFIPKDTELETVLLGEDAIDYLSPVLMNSKFEFATYCPSFFVKLKTIDDLDVVEDEAKKLGLNVVGANRFNSDIIKLKTDKHGMDVREAIDHFNALGVFAIVSPNLMHTVSDCNVDDPRYERQWHLKNDGTPLQGNGTPGADIEVEPAWAVTTGDANIKIAILDSGVDTLHPELAGKLLPGFDAFNAGTNGYPIPNYPSDGHGTACAGIAAANTNNGEGVAGVCPDCSIIPIRVFEYVNLGGTVQPFSSTEVFMDGLSWMWQEGNADVASNSWGVPDGILELFPAGDPLLVNAIIDDAIEQGRGGLGVPMLFSSGNDGVTDTIPIWPARYEKTIAVGATSMCDEHKSPNSCDGENWAGNWGHGLDVSAPGVRVATIDMLGTNGYHNTEYYNMFNGTSAACPNAAGVMALMLSHTPTLPEWLARKSLALTCEKVGGYWYGYWKDAGTWSMELGYGRVNAYQAVTYGASGIADADNDLRAIVETHSDAHVIRFDELANRTWQLIDLNGRVVSQGTSNNIITVDHNGLATGVYALRVEADGGLETLKLVVR